MGRIQTDMLTSVAQTSGLEHCGSKGEGYEDGAWRRQLMSVDGEASVVVEHGASQQLPHPRRGLRTGGRGSNSIVGLSSVPAHEILVNVPCGGSAETAQPADPFDSGEKEVVPGMAGAVVIAPRGPLGENENSRGEAEAAATTEESGINSDIILASTNTDGQLTIQKRIQRTTNTQNQHLSTRTKDTNNEKEEEEEEGMAFNYVSTQSIPKQQSSHTKHNPLTSPSIFMQRSGIIDANNGNNRPPAGTGYPNTNGVSSTETKKIQQQPRNSGTCTVIQGHMNVYTTSTPAEAAFENLEGRILAAIRSRMNIINDEKEFALGVRMHRDDNGLPAQSPGYVTGLQSGNLNDQPSTNSAVLAGAFTAPMVVLVALGGLLVLLTGLFVKTSSSKSKKRTQLLAGGTNKDDDIERSAHTYHEDDVEMDIHEVMERDDYCDNNIADDDYSVGQFSISSATVEVKKNKSMSSRIRSLGSPSRKSFTRSKSQKNHRGDDDVSETRVANLVSDQCEPMADPNLEAENSWKRGGPNNKRSAGLFGLFGAANKSAGGAEADTSMLLAEHTHRVGGGTTDSEADSLASEIRHLPHGNIEEERNTLAEQTGLPQSILQFFKAREQIVVTPHSEVEASLQPFDDISEYSASVALEPNKKTEPESQYFFNSTADEDRIMLTNEEGQVKPKSTRLVRRFNKMLKRVRSRHDDNGDEDDSECDNMAVDIEEIHQIYSYDDKARDTPVSPPRSSKRMPRGPTPVYTMNKQESRLTSGDVVIRSPSSIAGRTRSQSRPVSVLGQIDCSGTVASRGASRRGYDTNTQYTEGDDGSVAVVVAGNPMCSLNETWDVIPECWNPFSRQE